MTRSEEYIGPERRARDEWQIGLERRMDEVETAVKKVMSGLTENTEKTEHIEQSVEGLELKVRELRHDLRGYAQVQSGIDYKVRKIETTTSETHEMSSDMVRLLRGFTTLNKLVGVLGKLSKPLIVIGAAWAAVKGFFK